METNKNVRLFPVEPTSMKKLGLSKLMSSSMSLLYNNAQLIRLQQKRHQKTGANGGG